MVVERLSYDAWGKRRFANGGDDSTNSITSQTTKGFTGHEHIASVGLINMNARIYDPTIGRFMTPDSVVQDAMLSQTLNRYGYCGNNPLSFTDPTGHIFGIDDFIFIVAAVLILSPIIKEIPILGSIVVIAAGAICGPPCAATASAAITGVNGGDFGDIVKSFVLTYAEASAFEAVGDFLNPEVVGADGIAFRVPRFSSPITQSAAKLVSHGTVGGAFAALRGGSFESGFLSSGLSSQFNLDLGNRAANVALKAVVGGAASVAGGGKFMDGAVTGAFSYLFNDLLHDNSEVSAEQRKVEACLSGASNYCAGANQAAESVIFDVLGGPAIGRAFGLLGRGLSRMFSFCCFEAGTMVDTETGLRPIESIKIGDRVLSRDDVSGQTAYKPVVNLIAHHDRIIWKLKLSSPSEKDGKTLVVSEFHTTDDHPWRTATGDWLKTMDLKQGVQVLRANGPPARVVSVENTNATQPTFNLEVADFHTYFVGSERIWVHNSCYSAGKQTLLEMLRLDIRKNGGKLSREDFEAYHQLDSELPDAFKPGQVRIEPSHGPGTPDPHGHFGPGQDFNHFGIF